jgi:hypothetical protein
MHRHLSLFSFSDNLLLKQTLGDIGILLVVRVELLELGVDVVRRNLFSKRLHERSIRVHEVEVNAVTGERKREKERSVSW